MASVVAESTFTNDDVRYWIVVSKRPAFISDRVIFQINPELEWERFRITALRYASPCSYPLSS